MPFYEYRASDPKKSCEYCKDVFEVMQPITSEHLTQCPECGNKVDILISRIGGIVWKGRQCNQYSDVKSAKYWWDNDGNKWPVTPADGHNSAPTVPNRRKRSDEEVAAIKKRDAAQRKKRRQDESYSRFLKNQKRGK